MRKVNDIVTEGTKRKTESN